ncbi:MAG: hypothetical protein BWX50_01343 [Euryarchaeota archaeon ADurb.Bin009]|nr:MAG: hypothetical protein BWX50_01343 [Euryarchaeota archaeon ADurb.Bin009]
MIGQVIQVEMNTLLVAWSAAPIQAQACADCALSWYQGWKWSSAHIESKPTFSALIVCSSASMGRYCSRDAK